MNSPDTSHLVALLEGLSHERERLANAVTEKERKHRLVWIGQLEKEVAAEYAFLGMSSLPDISDDDLLRELEG